MANDFWAEYNRQQRKIMEERDKANRGKDRPAIKPSKRVPGTPVKKAPAKKK